MSVILLILGVVMVMAGIATIGFGIPINEFTLGTTLMIAGTTALTGGLVLIGLSAVVTELGRLAEGMRSNSAARTAGSPEPLAPAAPAPVIAPPVPAAAAVRAPQPQPSSAMPPPLPPRPQAPVREAPPSEPYPAGPSAVEVSAAAIERLRSSIPRTERPRAEPSVADVDGVPLSPNNGGVQHPQQRARPVEAPPPEPTVTAEDRTAGGAVEALKASRLDFLFRSKPARPTLQAQPENFDSFWPADARAGKSPPAEAGSPPRAEQIERQADVAAPAQDRRPEPAPAEESRPAAAAILKSGVVDGMAYTLYADGSIEAKLPHGTVRFGSIAELRAHIESNS
jgi:hypothetical protein